MGALFLSLSLPLSLLDAAECPSVLQHADGHSARYCLFGTSFFQAEFLVERLGGPKLYTQRKGKHYRLIARHAPYDLNSRSAKRWLEVGRNAIILGHVIVISLS